jgi:putative oxidoreductase
MLHATPANPVRRVGRALLAAMFVSGGLDAIRHPEGKVAKASAVIGPLEHELQLDVPATTLVRVNGSVQVAAGALLASSRMPRVAAFALACSLVPTTVAGHRFWEESDPAQRAAQRIHFLKNVSMLGGLLVAATS